MEIEVPGLVTLELTHILKPDFGACLNPAGYLNHQALFLPAALIGNLLLTPGYGLSRRDFKLKVLIKALPSLRLYILKTKNPLQDKAAQHTHYLGEGSLH